MKPRIKNPAAVVPNAMTALVNLAKHVVQRTDETCRLGMMRCFKLFNLLRVAPVAVIRRDYYRYLVAIVVKVRRIAFIRLVTGVAIHALLVVGAAFPLLDNSGCGVLMTGQATFSFVRYFALALRVGD